MERITLNMVPTGVLEICHASQYDIGREIRFDLINGTDDFVLSGDEDITIFIRDFDGNLIESSAPNTSSNYVVWMSSEGELDVSGPAICELRVTKDDDVLGSANFIMEIEADAYDGTGVHVETVGPADICTVETNLAEPLQSVVVDIEASQESGTPTPSTPLPIAGHADVKIVNTQNDNIVDLFAIDGNFRGVVNFNQIIYDGNFSESPSVWFNSSASTNLVISDGVATYEATANYAQIATPSKKINVTLNHKYLCGITAKASTNRSIAVGSTNIGYSYKAINTEFSRVYSIRNASATILEYPIIVAYSTVSGDIISVKDAVIIDLTQLFGATIADYIYTLEQNSPGAGVAFFRSIYPADYYEYNAGNIEIVGKETADAMISLGQTIYGGVLDVTSGKLTVTHIDCDLSTLHYSVRATGTSKRALSTQLPSLYPVKDSTFFLAEKYGYKGATTGGAVSGDPDSFESGVYSYTTVNPTTDYIYFIVDDLTATSATGRLVYELATPFDIDLTPVQISALALPDSNNVFADCGETTVKYLKAGE